MDEKNMRAAEQPSGQNPPQGEEKAEKGRLFEAGLTYTVTAVLPVLVSFLLSVLLSVAGVVDPSGENWYRYLSFLLPQLCFLAAAAVYFARTREPVLRTVGKCRWQYYLLAVLIQFGLLSLSELNTFFLWLLSFFGYEQTPVSLPDLTGWNILPALLVIAVLPALFEETVFRGILVGNMRRGGWGTVPTVLISGALFSLFHTNPAQTAYQFVCGVCFALIAVRSGSILPTMLSHFLNNAFVLVMAACGMADFPQAVKLPLYLCAGVCLAAGLAFLVFFDKKEKSGGGVRRGKSFFSAAFVGILVCALSWLLVLLTGVVHD